MQPSNYSGLVYNTIEFRYDSVECGTGLTTPANHVLAKNTAAGATSNWARVATSGRATSLGAPYGYQFVVAKNATGAASQVFSVFDSTVSALSSPVFVQQAAPVATDVTNINEVKVWPNPFNTDLNIGYNVESDVTITISMMDMNGRQLNTQLVKAQKGYNSLSINGSELPAGMYLINLIQNNEVKTFRVVKTN